MIKIFGSPKSSAGRCFWTLEAVGATYDNVTINFREREHKGPEFLKLNKNGKVPALLDGDFAIWESMAINFYLAEKYKPELLGTSIESKGLVHQWSFWAISELQPHIIQAFIQKVFVPEEKRSQSIIDEALAKVKPLLEVLEDSVPASYLVDNKFSLADINVLSVVEILYAIQYDISSYKKINTWMESVRTEDSYKRYQKLANP